MFSSLNDIILSHLKATPSISARFGEGEFLYDGMWNFTPNISAAAKSTTEVKLHCTSHELNMPNLEIIRSHDEEDFISDDIVHAEKKMIGDSKFTHS
jgi:hypothetical protein